MKRNADIGLFTSPSSLLTPAFSSSIIDNSNEGGKDRFGGRQK